MHSFFITLFLILSVSSFSYANNKIDSHLIEAVESGDLELVQDLISKGADINIKDSAHNPPLSIAARKGRTDIVNYLLSFKNTENKNFLDINFQNPSDGWTALMLASTNGHVEAVKALVNHNANVNLQGKFGETALMYAAFKPYDGKSHKYLPCRIEVVRVLVENNAIIDLQDGTGDTALTYTVSNRGECPDVAELLIKNRANIHHKNKFGMSILHNVAYFGGVETTKYLFSQNQQLIDLEIRGKDDLTPIFYAILKNKLDILNLFLSHGAAVDAKNIDGSTPLMDAVALGRIEAMKILINAGADVNAFNNYLFNPLQVAVEETQIEALELLLNNNADPLLQGSEGLNTFNYATALLDFTKAKHIEAQEANIQNIKRIQKLAEKIINLESIISVLEKINN